MGNDGGSIHHRAELVKLKKQKKADSKDHNRIRARECALSGSPLKMQIVVD
jgi:hypothetical protein